jgi:hypothetical protein
MLLYIDHGRTNKKTQKLNFEAEYQSVVFQTLQEGPEGRGKEAGMCNTASADNFAI